MKTDEHNVPTPDELKALALQISFLGQIRSLWQDITEESERFSKSLKEQQKLLEEQRCFFEDLSLSISECEESFESLTRRFTEGKRSQENPEKAAKKTCEVDEETENASS